MCRVQRDVPTPRMRKRDTFLKLIRTSQYVFLYLRWSTGRSAMPSSQTDRGKTDHQGEGAPPYGASSPTSPGNRTPPHLQKKTEEKQEPVLPTKATVKTKTKATTTQKTKDIIIQKRRLKTENKTKQRGKLTILSVQRNPLRNERDPTLRPRKKNRNDSRRGTPQRWQTTPVIRHPKARAPIRKSLVDTNTVTLKRDVIKRKDTHSMDTKINRTLIKVTISLRRNAVDLLSIHQRQNTTTRRITPNTQANTVRKRVRHSSLDRRGWWGYRRYHWSLSGGGGAIEDIMGLFQGVVGL